MATSTNPPVRVGWLSTASIGRKNSWALKLAGGVPAVVGSRSLAKAQEYAKAWGFERAVGSYEEVISDPSVDAVYIPLPTGLRVEWALKAIAAGKSVLMDKPTATSLDGMMSVVAAAKAKGVALMDGVMFMHNARQEAIAEYLWAGESGPLGSPRIVSSVFGFNADEEWQNSNIRTDPTLEPAGCLGDLTWYPIRFALFAFKWESPSHARCDVHQRNAKGVPTETTVTLFWPDGRRGVFTNSFHLAFQQSVDVACTKGTLALDDFVLNRDNAQFTVVENPGLDDFDRIVRISPTTVSLPLEHGHQESNMWRTFCGMVASRKPDPFWPGVALKTQAVLDACVASASADGAKVVVAAVGDETY